MIRYATAAKVKALAARAEDVYAMANCYKVRIDEFSTDVGEFGTGA